MKVSRIIKKLFVGSCCAYGIIVLALKFLYPHQLDYYVVKDMHVEKVCLSPDHRIHSEIPMDLNGSKVGLKVTLSLDYISMEDSRHRFIFDALDSSQLGMNGMYLRYDATALEIKMKGHENISLGESIYSEELTQRQRKYGRYYDVDVDGVSYEFFLKAMRRSYCFISANDIDNRPIYFWCKNDSLSEVLREAEIEYSLP